MIFERQQQIDMIKKWQQKKNFVPFEAACYDHNTLMDIESITNTGLLTLNFSSSLVVPKNWSLINSTVFSISVTNVFNDNKLTNWTVLNFTTYQIEIQLIFNDSKNISISKYLDSLNVTILNSSVYLISSLDKMPLLPQTAIYQIPPQIQSLTSKESFLTSQTTLAISCRVCRQYKT